ncbi:bifunctional ADP-dependent NAD(P)H-hydrate dehydratase/NAD(P)H-hydrate epimerase [soil metagenome]
MLKILSPDQIKSLDAATIQREPITSIALMERACEAFIQWFSERFDPTKRIGIVCGTGNNGGDGLGIARILKEWGYPVKVWIVKGKESEDFKINLDRLKGKVEIDDFPASSKADIFSDRQILIDSIFGSGLSRAAEGIYAQAINEFNNHQGVRIAIDIPSGLFSDKHSAGVIARVHHTVSFQLPKLAFLFPENYQYVGQWHIADIGLDRSFIQSAQTPYYYLTRKSVKKILKPRSMFEHKGDHGKALLIAGSYGKMGACILSARACLRAGVGLLTAHIPRTGYSIVQSAVPEAMTSVDANNEFLSEVPPLDSYDVIGIGPGLGQSPETIKAFTKILAASKPMVIDADGLNILAANSDLLQAIPSECILTPHPKEFERLVGSWKDDFDRLEKQIRLSKEIKAVIILKGAHTSIATPAGNVYFNSTGNPGMAIGGAGDVLTGILTGLLAQKYSAEEAAIMGVYLHGLSGDLAAREKGMNSLISSDLIDFLPAAFKSIL